MNARAGNFIFSNEEFKIKDLTIVIAIHNQIIKYWLTTSNETTLEYLGYISQLATFGTISLKTQHRIKSLFGVNVLQVFGNKTHSV